MQVAVPNQMECVDGVGGQTWAALLAGYSVVPACLLKLKWKLLHWRCACWIAIRCGLSMPLLACCPAACLLL